MKLKDKSRLAFGLAIFLVIGLVVGGCDGGGGDGNGKNPTPVLTTPDEPTPVTP
jgi:hypothetical protein